MNYRNSRLYMQKYFLLLSVLLGICSCRSNKDLAYLSKMDSDKILLGIPAVIDEYRIQPNDNLFVSVITPNAEMNEIYNPATVGNVRTINNVWQNASGQLVQGYLVEQDGTLQLPSIGIIEVNGLTMSECEQKIQTKAKEYLKDVTVKVRLLNYKITVLGEVKSPGVYYNYNFEFTIMDAISSASGITNSANLENILVLRRTSKGSITYKLDLRSGKSLSSPAYFLQPNDVVMVQPSRFKNLELKAPIYTIALSTITTFLLVLNYININN